MAESLTIHCQGFLGFPPTAYKMMLILPHQIQAEEKIYFYSLLPQDQE